VNFLKLTSCQNLRLREDGREMIYKGTLNKRDGELHVYLFDHALLFTKLVKTKQHEQFKVYRRVSVLFYNIKLSPSHLLPLTPKYSRYPLNSSISLLLMTRTPRMVVATGLSVLDIVKV